MYEDGLRVRNKPRFLFVSDQHYLGSAHELQETRPVRIAWRMIAGNNRAIARSPRIYESLDECANSAQHLTDNVDELQSAVLFDERKGGWWWHVHLDGELVAKSVYPARRRIEVARASSQFLEVLRLPPASPRVVRNLGIYAHGRVAYVDGVC